MPETFHQRWRLYRGLNGQFVRFFDRVATAYRKVSAGRIGGPIHRSIGTTAAVMLLLVALTALTPLAQGFGRPYWHAADRDVLMVQQPLMLNSGQPQSSFDHPSYLNFLLLAGWYRLLAAADLVEISTYAAFMKLDPAATERALDELVAAGRVLSVLIAAAFVLLVYFGIRRLTRDRGPAVMMAAMFACGWGVAVQTTIIRTELLSALLVVAAFFAMVEAARSRGAATGLWLGAAGFLSMAAMLVKIQVIVMLLGFPVLALVLRSHLSGGAWRPVSGRLAAGVVVAAAAAGIVAAVILWGALERGDRFSPPGQVFAAAAVNGSLPGAYQFLTLAWIAAGMAVYGVAARVPLRVWTVGAGGFVIGASAGVMLVFIVYHPDNLRAVVNYLDQSLYFAAVKKLEFDGAWSSQALDRATSGLPAILFERLGGMARAHLSASGRQLMELFVIVGIAMAVVRRRWRPAGLAAIFLGLALGIELAFRTRYMPHWYFIYLDPWRVLALAVLMADFLAEAPQARPRRTAMLAAPAIVYCAVLLLKTTSASFIVPQDFSRGHSICGKNSVYGDFNGRLAVCEGIR